SSPRLQLEGDLRGLAGLLDAELRDQKRWLEQVAHATRRPMELVEADLASALNLSPEGALGYRLIDEVVGSPGSSTASVT
ncbi:MAG: hypothetical protein M0T72_10490, partial [Candidatus Dormibacteraeota bacterium]|nr:hypothetical protein [Candidatus Dormibacteraeota bacterium]